MTRVAVGGFLHETNTFAPSKAEYRHFLMKGGWPEMSIGDKLLSNIRNINVGMAGFLDVADREGWDIVPTVWCGASPSAHVTEDAYERIARMIVDGIRDAGDIDAVYLDLHGAMTAEHVDDGEGEIARRVREVIGPDLPFVVSLDLHANVTPLMIEATSALVAYRTYPHVDMADTGAASAAHLRRLLNGEQFAKAFRQIPFLIPISWQATTDQPCKGIYEHLKAMEGGAIATLSFTPGFPATDFADCGAAVFAYGRTQADADRAADELTALVMSHERDFDGKIYQPDEGVRHAMMLSQNASKPIVIADTQDNSGAGSNSDTTGMLRALVRNNASRAAIGMIVDPEAAEKIHAAGEGATITIAIGGKSGVPGDSPYEDTFVVEKLWQGEFHAPGPYFGGAYLDVGLAACLRIGDVRIVIGSRKVQLADQAMYRCVGIEPTEQAILVNKSSVHFRADFEPIAEAILICAAPGSMPADPSVLPWKRLRPGVRLKPMGTTVS